MKKTMKIVGFVIIFVFGTYLAYRIYHVWQLNMRLEKFMAQQVKGIQDKYYDEQWFKDRQITKPSEYFITRVEAYYIHGNHFFKDKESHYVSRWISDREGVRRITQDEPGQENSKDWSLVWVYSIRPLSGSEVCIMLESHQPMVSVGGTGEYTLDTSAPNWQLVKLDPSKSSCNFFRDTELLRTMLVYVQ